jgi:ParB-like chromosome segregation protein Spo0J
MPATKRPGTSKPPRKAKSADLTAQPISRVEWIDPSALHANDYNPNTVFGPEMELLKRSILAVGWTQPIVARRSGEIIDGFHRWTLASRDGDVQALTAGKCPVVFVDGISREEQIVATVRHNRARGQHGVLRMGDIVRALIASGMSEDDVGAVLQMEDEEVQRLADLRGSPEQAGRDHFGKGWMPTRAL